MNFPDVNMTGDSSEEDEDILPSKLNSNPSNNSNGVLKLAINQEDEEEVDEEILPISNANNDVGIVSENGNQAIKENMCSIECSEAMASISNDCWDISSWIVYMDEVEQGKGGSISLSEMYERVVQQFPLTSKFWMKLIGYTIHINDFTTAEEHFSKCLNQCRSVELWSMYIGYVRLKCPSLDSIQSKANAEQISLDKKKCEQAYEKAIENVGMALEGYEIWRQYIDFVKGWSEHTVVESGRKIAFLRKIYQRAVVTPMDQLEEIWDEYETFEKHNGEQFADSVLPELNKQTLHARSIYRERRKLTNQIMFDRIAIPPANFPLELQQIDLWNNWIKFEMTNPDNLSEDAFKGMIRMIFEQCICGFRYNAEVWSSYARFEIDHQCIHEARTIFQQAILIMPHITFLRIFFAEMEEVHGKSIENAHLILRSAFESIPSGFTFFVLQRFIRRHHGMIAARKVFKETHSLRQSDANLGLEICLAHANLELDVNCRADVSLKVLNMARESYPSLCAKNIVFIRLITSVLLRTDDYQQIRWIYQSALVEEDSSADVIDGYGVSSAVMNSNRTIASSTGMASNTQDPTLSMDIPIARGNKLNGKFANKLSLQEEYILLDDLLWIETLMNQENLVQLAELRKRRDKAKLSYEEFEKVKMLGGLQNKRDKDELQSMKFGLYDACCELAERYCTYPIQMIPLGEADFELQERCLQLQGGSSYPRLSAMLFNDISLSSMNDYKRSGSSYQRSTNIPSADRYEKELNGLSRDPTHLGTSYNQSISGLPPILKDFLTRLPVSNQPAMVAYDVDGFIRQMKNIVLPPRPTVDFGMNEGGEGEMEEFDPMKQQNATGNDWMTNLRNRGEYRGGEGEMEYDDVQGMDEGLMNGQNSFTMPMMNYNDNIPDFNGFNRGMEDIFRRRQRNRVVP